VAFQQLRPVKPHLADAHDADFLKRHSVLLFRETFCECAALRRSLYATSIDDFKVRLGNALSLTRCACRVETRFTTPRTTKNRREFNPSRRLLRHESSAGQPVAPIWELRVGEYRVINDVSVDESVVYVRAVRKNDTEPGLRILYENGRCT
jgi:hypothetical protein